MQQVPLLLVLNRAMAFDVHVVHCSIAFILISVSSFSDGRFLFFSKFLCSRFSTPIMFSFLHSILGNGASPMTQAAAEVPYGFFFVQQNTS